MFRGYTRVHIIFRYNIGDFIHLKCIETVIGGVYRWYRWYTRVYITFKNNVSDFTLAKCIETVIGGVI